MEMAGGVFLNDKPPATPLLASPRSFRARLRCAREIALCGVVFQSSAGTERACAPRKDCGALLKFSRQLLFHFQDRREDVAALFQTLQGIAGLEIERLALFFLHLPPFDRHRDKWVIVFRAERINADGRFMVGILAP